MKKENLIWGILRLALGWIFLWAFLDKVFGLGFATTPGKAWINGVSPTYGFLKFGTTGILSPLYHIVANNPLIAWLFMLGLLFIGLSLMLGIFVKLGSYAGIIMLFLMWLGLFPSSSLNNPFLDEHLIYIIILFGFILVNAGDFLGIGVWWSNLPIITKYKILR